MLVRPSVVLGFLGCGLGLFGLTLTMAREAPAAQLPPQSKPVGKAKPKPGDAARDSNLDNCLHGLSGCDVSALSPDEIKQVSQVSKKKNFDSCMEGSTLCDPTRLAPAEVNSVQAARYR